MAVDLPPPTNQEVSNALQDPTPAVNHLKQETQTALQHFEATTKKKVILASNKPETAEEKRINEQWEKMTLEDVYQDNIKYLNYYFDPLRLAYDVEKFKKNRAIITKLNRFYKKLGGDSDLSQYTVPLDLALVMHDQFYDMLKNDKKTKTRLLKNEIRGFSFKLIDIIKPFLK
jgi:hypothetical protein